MASATVSAASHQFTPMPIPRIRPPRMLKGSHSPNSNPQPEGAVPAGQVWVQGRWRLPASNAAKNAQAITSRRVEKALRHEIHGMNIYAYSHLRTNQVVYSLTKILDNTNVLRQLIYHGKKTVPAAVRRDLFRPYFSIHFPQTPAGAKAGLLAYHRLRELSLQRQLSPPEELLITTEQDIERVKNAAGSPAAVEEKLKEKKPDIKGDPRLKVPRLGQILPKKLRARKVMNQKASSVADAAFVLELAKEGGSFEAQLEASQLKLEQKYEGKGYLGRKKIRRIRREEESEAAELKERANFASAADIKMGKMPVDRHTADRLSMEYQGAVGQSNQLADMEVIESKNANMGQRTELENKIALEIKAAQSAALQKASRGKIPPRDKSTEIEENAITAAKTSTEQSISSDLSVTAEASQLSKEARRKRILAEAQEEYMIQARKDPSSAVSKLERLKDESQVVDVLWADLRDGTYAESWPDYVYHATLAPRAIAYRQISRVRQPEIVDADGHIITEQKERVKIFHHSSVHVMGTQKPDEYRTHAVQIDEELRGERDKRVAEYEEVLREQEEEERALREQEEKEATEREKREADMIAQQNEQGSGPEEQYEVVKPLGEKKSAWERVKGLFGR